MTISEGFTADVRAAERELRAALTKADIELPSLGLDPSAWSPAPFVLVNLGAVRPHVARDLAAVIRGGALTALTTRPARPVNPFRKRASDSLDETARPDALTHADRA